MGGETLANNRFAYPSHFPCFLGQEEVNRKSKAEEPFTFRSKVCVYKLVGAMEPVRSLLSSPATATPSGRQLCTHADKTFDLVLVLLMENWEEQHRTRCFPVFIVLLSGHWRAQHFLSWAGTAPSPLGRNMGAP